MALGRFTVSADTPIMRARIFITAGVLSLLALSLFAGSSGTTGLFTAQGSSAGLPFGDFVSDAAAGALNRSYRFYIEVPSTAGRLQVDIFDADIGLGGAGDATANRDRDRAGYDSAVTYRLFDPSGTEVTTRFTTGNNAGPLGSDNAWLTLYSATGNNVADNFGTAAFTNNDGNNNWAAAWNETDGGGAGAGAGAIRVTGGELRIQDGIGGTPSIDREADLLGSPGLGLSQAFFSFDYRTSNDLEDADQLSVQVSNNGGGSWTTLETFSNDSSGSRTYDITAFIANNTRIRFLTAGGLSGTEFFFFDNVRIHDGTKTAGHWELRVDMSNAVTGGDDINAFGLRAHDGTSGSGGTELNVYADSMLPVGVNPPAAGVQSRAYDLFPLITSGCTCSQNDFDLDSDAGNVGSFVYTSNTGAFTQTFNSATLSANNVWNRDNATGWTSDARAVDYGVWTVDATVSSYLNPAVNGNYGTYYVGNFQTAANPPNNNPLPNTHRVYLANDAGTAPVKPYLEQELTADAGPAITVGQTRLITVTLRIVNPTAHAIVFSTPSNVVTANVPGGTALYAGPWSMSQGTIVSQPAMSGSGNVVWNPGTVAAGATVVFSYRVAVTPTSAGQRVLVTATPASGNGTRAQFLDETGNTSQARATFLAGPVCELAVTEGFLTDVLLSSFDVDRSGVRWTTASEAGTLGFNLYREDGSRVNDALIPSKKNGKYHVHDSAATEGARYTLEEVMVSGRTKQYGPMNRLERVAPSTRQERITPAMPSKHAKKAAAAIASFDRAGIARITANDLAAVLGANPNQVAAAFRNGGVRVTDRGSEVAWTNAGDAMLFVAQPANSIYSNDRAYRIELAKGTQMKSVNVASSNAPLSTFTAALELERDVLGATILPVDPESDYWFWDFVLSGDATYGTKTFAVDVPAVASDANASLEMRLQGALDGAQHEARIRVNGVPVGEARWNALDARTATVALPAGVLRDGANEIAIEGILESGAPYGVFYVDGFTVRYERFAKPDAGVIEVARGGAVTAGPFTSAPVVLDTTSATKPALLQGWSFASSNVSLTAPGATQKVLIAESFVAPTLRASAELSLKSQRADWIVIAPRAMRGGAESLANFRQREGLQPLVVDLEQVYDEFAGGNTTPHAIRDFLASTRTWSKAPRYVVLAGTGTVDYRNIEVPAGPMPPMMARTSDGLFASDSAFVDFNRDGLPDLAIGRIPAATAADLDAYVAKLERRSNATAPLLFSADAADQAADFRAVSERARAALGNRPSSDAYVDDLGAAGARNALMNAWRNGASLVAWTGHGGHDQISTAGVLTSYDAESLTASTLPVVVAMTCTINRFENGYVEPLGAALTRAANAGALAVWSASGLSKHGDAAELQRTFTHLASEEPNARVGDLIVRTLTSRPSATGNIYLLLGDPAVRLQLPTENAHEPTSGRTGE